MNHSEYCSTLNEIIEKQEKDMEQDLHTVGKLCYKIFDKTTKLANVLPDAFKTIHLCNAYEYVGDSFKYIVEKHLGHSITLKYEGRHKFTYREIKEYEDSEYIICLENLDDTVNATDIYTDVWNLLGWIEHYADRNDERIRNTIKQLENM